MKIHSCITKFREYSKSMWGGMWIHQKLLQKLQKVYIATSFYLPKYLFLNISILDKHLKEAIKYAEKLFCKFHMGEVSLV